MALCTVKTGGIRCEENVPRVPKRRIPGKMLYLVSQNVPKKWTQSYRGWNQMLNQLTVLYGERLTQYL